jgi:hypothetical protein
MEDKIKNLKVHKEMDPNEKYVINNKTIRGILIGVLAVAVISNLTFYKLVLGSIAGGTYVLIKNYIDKKKSSEEKKLVK